MALVMKVAGGLVALVALAAAGTFVWADSASEDALTKTYATHEVDFPIPFPLTEAEITQLRAERAASAALGDAPADPAAAPDPLAGVDLDAIAKERAIGRGKHLVEARYGCGDCHGADFGGGVMVDDPALGRFLGVNLTMGEGSRTREYTAKDWDRIVRHGVKPDGTAAVMPSGDFVKMTDRELSDIVSYVRSVPPIDLAIEPSTLGPVGKVLVATGKLAPSASLITDHAAAHAAEPPDPSATLAFGEHLASPCVGCHRASFEGGPILGGDPAWPPGANLTPHADGLQGWTEADFVGAMRSATSKSGAPLRPPMDGMAKYAANMSDEELHAMWTYISSLPPKPDGQ